MPCRAGLVVSCQPPAGAEFSNQDVPPLSNRGTRMEGFELQCLNLDEAKVSRLRQPRQSGTQKCSIFPARIWGLGSFWSSHLSEVPVTV